MLGSSSNFINVQVTIEQLGTWRFTGFYGNPDWNRRRDSWAMLRQLVVSSTISWCIMGDFNNLLALSEKGWSFERSNFSQSSPKPTTAFEIYLIQMSSLTTKVFEISGFQMS